MIKVGHKTYTDVGTEGHIDHGKQTPQVLIVGGVSVVFQAAYAQLKIMEAAGEVMLVHQEIDEPNSVTVEYDLDEEISKVLIDTWNDLSDNTSTDKKHSHPHWHEGRW
ncbi:hypothetical protein MYOV085v1_p0050 [Vibrio phage 355E48.1]|nr:hypothetical protein MYOV085v1_p0050 [Vibrio phage 355E48.1]